MGAKGFMTHYKLESGKGGARRPWVPQSCANCSSSVPSSSSSSSNEEMNPLAPPLERLSNALRSLAVIVHFLSISRLVPGLSGSFNPGEGSCRDGADVDASRSGSGMHPVVEHRHLT
jgi:hypothetical protein